MEKYDEYKAVGSDDLRQAAFEKVLRRLREKEEDADKLLERFRGDRRDYHDRDRDHRRGSDRKAATPSSRRSRTPEHDAYEADRRKAQADRERSYRRTGPLSPIRERRDDRDREKDRTDRDRYRERRDRDHDRRPPSHYELERREREEERERLYRTRGDPRGSRDELDYGADTPSERRRRCDSDTESVNARPSKRHRLESSDRDRSRGPRRNTDKDARAAAQEEAIKEEEAMKEEKAVHSGSEEGEIEEED